MSRLTEHLVTETVPFLLAGLSLGLVWWWITGSPDMTPWTAVLFIAVVEVVAQLLVEAVQYVLWRRRRIRGAPRHRAHARQVTEATGDSK
ncbi:hypothetical protein [Streptomyces sp. NPDC008150]|uniref:hypothetical protein n=1 Tax=Streptomyces sp. NPDC008150 TaxID=3364816 RepID=UPI0036F115C0